MPEVQVTSIAGNNVQIQNTADPASGVYFLYIITGGGNLQRKIIKK